MSCDGCTRLQRELETERERADYAWRNTNTIERARQEEMANRDELLAAAGEALDVLYKVNRHEAIFPADLVNAVSGLHAAIAKVKP